MNSRRFLLRLLTCVGFNCFATSVETLAQSPTRQTTKEERVRDLSRYEQGPSLTIRWRAPDGAHLESTVRSFLWTHWTKHQRAYMNVTRFNLEGESRESHYYVEQDQAGKWKIAVTIQSKLYPRGRPDRVREESISFDAYQVEKVPGQGWHVEAGYCLRLKDGAGKWITDL